jgi:flagellar basal body-associated protein FliL
MKRAVCLAAFYLISTLSCAPTPKYDPKDCALFTEIDPIRVNPAGALDRHLRVEAAFKVCPLGTGLDEIKRKRIELKHNLVALLSSTSATQLEDPLRVEKLRQAIKQMVNHKVMKKGRVIDVLITGFELE